MKTQRRFLPSISLLNAFESVARTGGVSAAARELSLTQGAVSRLIQKLESQLEVQLFHRVHRRMELTEAGRSYLPEIQKALETIIEASVSLRANPGGGTLRLAILPTMGTRWLAPLLPDFLKQHPGITLNLTTKLEPFDFNQEQLDAAVHFGSSDWAGTDHIKLFDEELVVVAAPDLLNYSFSVNKQTASFVEDKTHSGSAQTEAAVNDMPLCGAHLRISGLADPPENGIPANETSRHVNQSSRFSVDDVINLPLLHLKSRPQAWEVWTKAHGIERSPIGGMMIDQFATLSKVAVQGLGLALLPRFLITQELEMGNLVDVLGASFSSTEIGAYYLVWPETRSDYLPLQAFRDWLSEISDLE